MPQPASPSFSSVYSDDDIIVVNKPSGLLCVPGLSEPDNLFDRVKLQHPNSRVVHRLDMHTSGLVIFALHYEAQKALGRQFEKRLIRKTYVARVFGHLVESAGEIQSPIICDWPNRPRQKIDWLQGKPAHTFYKRERYHTQTNTTDVQLFPHTGRTHQLRVHMMQIGHPILGDNFYAHEQAQQLSPRLCLHAQSLTFTHPIKDQTMQLEVDAEF